MAYTPTKPDSIPVPVEPMVLGPIRVGRAAGELNYPIYIPWQRVKLVYAYALTTTAVATADFECDLELNAASGTEMMTCTVGQSGSAIGDIDEFTVSSAAACRNLGRHDTDRDMVVIEAEASNNAGALDIFMYFEPDIGT